MKLNNNDDSHNSGLNLLIYNMLLDIESHPAWVCGLKPYDREIKEYVSVSHPAWVCGLKLSKIIESHCAEVVTPCVGVWIETLHAKKNCKVRIVTPCVGVWIETVMYDEDIDGSLVTPCVGVWIETVARIDNAERSECHTLRGCVD